MKPFRYAIHDLELNRPLPGVEIAADTSGAAFLLRRGGRPAAFFMKRLRPGTTLSAQEVERLVAEKVGGDLLVGAIADELAGDPPRRLRST